MLTEEVDEGLVLLGKVMDWDPIDLTYASLLEARDGATRWDDKLVTKAPRPKDLHSAVSSSWPCVCVCVSPQSVACLLRDAEGVTPACLEGLACGMGGGWR